MNNEKSSNMQKVILVNKSDQILGLGDKLKSHVPDGLLHRAVSVWVVNSKGETLITKRSREKILWSGYWTNTVCSHPNSGESYVKAGERRLDEELGFSCKLKYSHKFIYEKKYRNVGWEREMCGVVFGFYDGEVKSNKKEVSEYRWVSWKDLNSWISKESRKFTPWFFLEKERLEKNRSFIKLIRK